MAKLSHIGLRVRDLDRSRKFYESVLGFRQARTVEMGETRLAFLEAEGTTIELVEKTKSPYPEGVAASMHLAFEVADVASEIQRLQGMDISLEGKDPVAFQGGFIFFFKGPDGEVLELCQG
jgi:lactoylglutathione lyase